jgi:hypothetical protein
MLGKKRIYSQHIQVKTTDIDKVGNEKSDLRIMNNDDFTTDRDT